LRDEVNQKAKEAKDAKSNSNNQWATS
jgi:hypothetical protein